MDDETKKVLKDIDDIQERLEEMLPFTDEVHREEIISICSLLRYRTEMYFNEYGAN